VGVPIKTLSATIPNPSKTQPAATQNPIKTITFKVVNNSNGTINTVYINNEVKWTGYISPGSSSSVAFSYNSNVFDVSNTTIKFDIYGSLTEITSSKEFNINFTKPKMTGVRLEEPEYYKYELHYI
jgi:hypothetical protein